MNKPKSKKVSLEQLISSLLDSGHIKVKNTKKNYHFNVSGLTPSEYGSVEEVTLEGLLIEWDE